VADRHGNLVTLTQSGSVHAQAEFPEGLGFGISSGMQWFDLGKDSVNRIEGGKRARWNMCPTIVIKDDKPFLAIGTPGYEGIWKTVPQALINIIDFGMDIQDAVEAPRFIDDTLGVLSLEGRIPVEVQKALSAKGHKIKVLADYTNTMGGMNGIMIHPVSNVFMGGGDPRRDGYVIGW
jgi:gamma-glutamyltranspeptidase/glutathione hydrolase